MRKYGHIAISIMLLMLLALGMIGASGCDSQDRSEQSSSTTLPVTSAEQPDDSGGMTASLPPVTETDLEKAAMAHKEITRINQNLQQSVLQTKNMDDRRDLQLKANKDMVLAAENAGLDFETYNRIMHQVRSDDQMEMVFQKKLESLE